MLPWETDPARYETLFEEKCDRVEGDFAALGVPRAQRFPSPPESYRVRAEFRIWHEAEALNYVMFDPTAPKMPVKIGDFAPALAPIRKLMPRLRERLEGQDSLRRKLFQAEFMATKAGEVVTTLIYHRPLDEAWETEAEALGEEFGMSIVGRSRKQKRVIGRDHVTEHFLVGQRRYSYRQYEQSFVQPNAPVNEQMLNWAWSRAADARGDLLELYCGNGNFTLPLATRYSRVLATELAKSGTRAALENLEANAIKNVAVVRLSAEEVSMALAGEREFRRLASLPQPLGDYQLDTVFVDPPRAGLDPATLECVRRFDTILYISCNPNTLRANLQALASSHSVSHFALFDQFPYTAHIECGVVLKRQKG
jgi:tRNA (uracil-5-)-methyltransferase